MARARFALTYELFVLLTEGDKKGIQPQLKKYWPAKIRTEGLRSTQDDQWRSESERNVKRKKKEGEVPIRRWKRDKRNEANDQ